MFHVKQLHTPICNVGKIDIASKIIPIPPNHCNNECHMRMPSGKLSKFDITEDPVVVIPLTDSKCIYKT